MSVGLMRARDGPHQPKENPLKRTVLSPRDAAWLTETFARNAARFGGWSMEADDDKGSDGGDKPADDQKLDGAGGGDKPADKGGDDKPLGEKGERALRAEREERKKLEGELSDLKKGLASALGLGEQEKEDGADALAKIQERLDAMQHENAVLAAANEHRITNKDDLALLESTKDVGAMKRLAERLAPAQDEGDATSRRPKPDRSQGGGGSGSGKTGGSVADVMAQRRAARETKNTSN